MFRIFLASAFSLSLFSLLLAMPQQQPVKGITIPMVDQPDVSPDGKWITFEFDNDIWVADSETGESKAITQHPSRDRSPKFSPDGKTIAFVSDREGSNQIFLIPAVGGSPKQVSFHTAGFTLYGWHSDGKHVLASGLRDHDWSGRRAERFFLIDTTERKTEQELFNDYGSNGTLSPDGKKLLFTREGHQWWRKGYYGSQASQIWMYDLDSKQFSLLLKGQWDTKWPMWKPDNSGFYYIGVPEGEAGKNQTGNIFEYTLANKQQKQLTTLGNDYIVYPALSRDGGTFVFRHLFDLYTYRPGKDSAPRKLALSHNGDRVREKVARRTLTTASQSAFSPDGLEVAFVAGGDIWVMDTELKEPKQITNTPEEEKDVTFSPDGDSVYFSSEAEGQPDLWKVERKDKTKHWSFTTEFVKTRITNDTEVDSAPKFSPDGKTLSYIRGRGDLMMCDPDGKNPRAFLTGWTRPTYEWSPDNKWLVYAVEDDEFNSDIWIKPIDNSRPAYNISRHPFNDGNPTWSPDGKMIAFVGRRQLEDTNVFYVYLQKEAEETGNRERTLEKALDKLNKARRTTTFPMTPAKDPAKEPAKDPVKDPVKADPPKTDPEQQRGQRGPGGGQRPGGGTPPPGGTPTPGGSGPAPMADDSPIRPLRVADIKIDFDGLYERVHQIVIPNSNEGGLFWSPDGKKLAFNATVESKPGIYYIEFPDSLTPKPMYTGNISQPRWIRASQVVGNVTGVPSSVSVSPAGGTATNYRFAVQQLVDLGKKHAAAFDQAWRVMRDNFYDSKLGNRDWNAVRNKYRPMAAQALDIESLATVISLMLGELNGSHLGFMPGRMDITAPPPAPGTEPSAAGSWREQTAHLGVRFDSTFAGPGLKIKDVIPKSPADQVKSRLSAGEVILTIDGKPVDIKTDLTQVLAGSLPKDFALKVQGTDGKERDVNLRSYTYTAARGALYDKWLADNRKKVEDASGGKFGYLHISAMSMPTFWKFQEELYSAGAGKDGLIIDVRENGGGSTADHLLTALTQPVHAVAIPRGGSPGYPQDRKIYASWNKPIVVLCNQNSFSNAEIFSHAVKTLKRGKVVGVPTAGGVISTGATTIMDVGTLRLPFRGWYLVGDGEDMELNGCIPDFIVWPEPGDVAAGIDRQINKAVEVMAEEVKAWKAQPNVKLKKATERK